MSKAKNVRKYQHWFETKGEAERILKRLRELNKKYPNEVTLADMRMISGAKSINPKDDDVIITLVDNAHIEKVVRYWSDGRKLKQFCIVFYGAIVKN